MPLPKGEEMVERTLSKTQRKVFEALSNEATRLQKEFQEVARAQAEQVELLRIKFDLPKGEYNVRQKPTGEIVLFRVSEEIDADKSKLRGELDRQTSGEHEKSDPERLDS